MLDVGCGNNPKGDVNCDLFLKETPHIMVKHKIDSKKMPNFVNCDATFLPFQDKSFDIVNASQVLEHMKNPILLLSEMKRVTKQTVTIDVPNLRRLTPEENPHHLYSWSDVTLKNLLNLFFNQITIIYSGYQCYLPEYLLRKRLFSLPFKILELYIEKILGPPYISAVCKI
jgi:SAM-dependent methyltransferase